ncbi:MAG: translocation/assembly module TamB [Gemmatimonadaceae bacterium]|nr:translocation/assembly module TamB [Gemmatimonadaceae bacterium]
MSRRRLVALVSAVLMLALGASVIGAFVLATQSDRGRELIRRVAEAQLSQLVRGRVRLGTLSGSFLTDLRIDSLRITDADDSLLVSTGPLRLTFDPRDLADGRIILRSAEVDRAFFAARRELGGEWTHEKIFRRNRVRSTIRRRSAFGAVFIVERVVVRDGEFALIMPWAPDSAPNATISRAWRWQEINLELPRARFAYPDSSGVHLTVGDLDVEERDPPFSFRDLAGEVRILGDTVFLDFNRFTLPGSTGDANGRIWWGRPGPVRYAIRVNSDSVSLQDIAWISPAIPTPGRGRMQLDIQSDPNDPSTIDYIIREMDVRAHRSRLVGEMTWGVGPRALALKDVNIEMAPLDAALLERFNQGPLAVPLRGQLRGRVRASGGPLDQFVVQDARASFTDANVPGATAQARASGTLDITDPGLPIFKGLRLDVAQFDLRSAQALDDEFPKLNGNVRGVATLDSIWGDVRFRDADLTHVDGDSPESRLRGDGRLSWDDVSPLRWELEAAALPLAFTALAKSFPAFPLRGEFSGPFRSSGTGDDFTLGGDLLGPAGRVESDLRVASIPQQRVVGRASLTNVDPRLLFQQERVPSGEVNGRFSVDVAGDSLAALQGEGQLQLDRSVIEGVRVFAGTAQLRFDAGRALLDTLYFESSAVDLSGRGALGLHEGVTDSLRIAGRADSLGGLRPWLRRALTDSLSGALRLQLGAAGWLRDFAVDATAVAENAFAMGNSADSLELVGRLRGLPTRPFGTLELSGSGMRIGGIGFADARVDADRDADGITTARLAGRGETGTLVGASGRLRGVGDTLELNLATLSFGTSQRTWQLAAPSRLAFARGGFRLDSLALAAGPSTVALAGALPAEGALDLRLRTVDFPLRDVAELLQLPGDPRGRLWSTATLTGTRAAPDLAADAEWRGGALRGVALDTLRARARAAADAVRLDATLGARARPTLVAEAVLPLALGLDGSGTRFEGEGPISGRLQSDSLGLELLQTITGGTLSARGTMAMDLTLGGTWSHPLAAGALRVINGSLAPAALGNVRWRGVEADIGFFGDSIAVRNVAATSSAGRGGSARLTGHLALADRANPLLDLQLSARSFNAIARPNLAEVDLSGDLRLTGPWRGATLRGSLTADRAIIAIPELASKDVISLEGPDRFAMLDTINSPVTRSAAAAPPDFVDNLTIANVPVRMGSDVWLRSTEANINLGGEVSVTRGRVTRGANAGELQLALLGPLQTQRGTYRLNLGPVQRTFTVEQGEIRFFGDPELNPTLDISALHTVRQYSEQGVRPDVRVRVHLGGTLQQPLLELSSPDSLRVTNADLLSYLVTGGPSVEIGGRNGDISATAARVVVGSLGSVLGGKASGGGICDDAQLSTAGLDAYGGRLRRVGGGILSGTRFNCAKQINDRTFVRLDAGLCQVGQLVTQGGGSDPLSFTDALGLKLDYLLGRGVSASIGVEPPTSALLCSVNANASARGFVPTPRQVGFDLFRTWRF